MKFIFVILLSALFVSCSSNTHSVILNSQLYHPYCGGAEPSPEQMKGYHTPNNIDIIVAGIKDSILLSIKGTTKVKLQSGTYRWYQGEKQKETQEILTSLKNDLGSNYIIQGQSCIDEWKNNPDGTFSISEKTDTIYLTLRYNCYTGLFPCVNYNGPRYP